MLRGQKTLGSARLIVQQGANDQRPVDSLRDCAPDAHVFETWDAQIEDEEGNLRSRTVFDDEIWPALQRTHHVRRERIDGHVGGTLFKFECAGCGVGNHGKADL